jgi:hypothetical protein
MDKQNPLLRILGLARPSSEDLHQQESLGPPPLPPPPAATTKQSIDINAPAPKKSLLTDPEEDQKRPTQSLLTPLSTSSSFNKSSLLQPENSIPKPRDGGYKRRQFARKPMPGGAAPEGEMASAKGQKWHISLWDVSMGGLCVVVDSPVDEPLGSLMAISVYESFGLGSAFFNVYLRWNTVEANATYLGLQFEDQELLNKGCFLMDYVDLD